MARRMKSLHHNLQEGMNVIYHREHRSPRNRSKTKKESLQKFDRSYRRKFKAEAKNDARNRF